MHLFTTLALGGTLFYEGMKAQQLWHRRGEIFMAAQARAVELGRPLLVVGDPDAGATTRFLRRAYGCGDLCVDLSGCPACPVAEAIDITQGLPGIKDDSAVVFVSCVLEYTDDPVAALRDLLRIAGKPENLFVVTVNPSTLTSYLYPGAKFQFVNGEWQKLDTVERVAVGAAVGLTTASLLWSLFRRK